ncbi:MAG: ATP-binding protein [Myxococcota bacterium]
MSREDLCRGFVFEPSWPIKPWMSDLDTRIGGLGSNRRIAVALLEVLAEDGDVATRARAVRALGDAAAILDRPNGWIPPERLRAMLTAARFDRRRARRIGQALVRPSALSLLLCYTGIASPAKMYRRVHQLLARESEGGRYEAVEVGDQTAHIRFHPAGSDSTEPSSSQEWGECGDVLCGLRQGMLASLPGLFGLTPARVVETACLYAGDPYCEFSAHWTRHPRSGMLTGAAIGLLAGGLAISFGVPAAYALAGLTLLGAAIGRSLDLTLQLEAVAGVRRGQLALLEQLDQGLSERMDALAQLQTDVPVSREPEGPASFEQAEGLVPASPHSDAIRTSPGETTCLVRQGAARIYESASALREDLASLQAQMSEGERTGLRGGLQSCEQHGRRIGEAASEIDRAVGGGVMRRKTDVRALIERVVATLKPSWPAELEIELDVAGAQPPVRCDPLQIEIVVEQLLHNAAAANGQVGRVTVSLRPHADGVEVAVLDEGEGIEADLLDQVFDPFVQEGEGDAPSGLGLPVCFRIVEEHGGELRIQTGEERGARVAFVLPVE